MKYSSSVKVMLEKSQASYRSATRDFSFGDYDRCVSSLYYSCFQSVVALMILNKEDVTKHTRVRSYVNKELALRGLMPIHLSKMYNTLMDRRSDADYSSTFVFTQEMVKPWLEQVSEFNRIVESIINKKIKSMNLF